MSLKRTGEIAGSVFLWSLPGLALGITMALTGELWAAVAAALVVLVVAAALLRRYSAALTNDRHVVATEHGVEGTIDAVEVFWRPGCPFVDGLGRVLADARVPTNLRNIRENPDDAAIVRSIADGHETVPTLIIGPVALVNPSPRLVMATLEEHAPHLLESRP